MRRLMSVAPWLLLVAVIYAAQARLERQAAANLPNAAELRLSRLTLEDYAALKRRAGFSDAAFYERRRPADVAGAQTEVRVIAAEADYLRLAGMRMVDGAAFIDTTERLAVISDELALSLFKSANAAGAVISLNDAPHTVCGVYAKDRSLLARLSSDGVDAVYVQLLSETESETGAVSITGLLVSAEDTPNLPAELQDRASALAAIGADIDSEWNHNETLELIRQNTRLTRLWASAGAAVCLCAFGMKKARAAMRRLAVSRQTHTRPDTRAVAEGLALCAVCAAAAVACLRLAAFAPYLPQYAFAADGRIHPALLLRHFIETAQALNAGAGFFAAYGHRAALWSFATACGSLAAVMRISARIRFERRTAENHKKQAIRGILVKRLANCSGLLYKDAKQRNGG